MKKNTIFIKLLSCLLALTFVFSSVAFASFVHKETFAATPTYTLSQVQYSQEIPVKWRFTNSSGYTYTDTLTTHYFRGEVTDNPSANDIVAYCMDWGVLGPSTTGTLYDHQTNDVSLKRINQLTYVIMNGYPYAKSYHLSNVYNVNRYNRPLEVKDDGGTGTMTLQLATQIATWLIMGSDSRGRALTTDGWVRNYNCQNLDCDVMEIAMKLYKDALAYSDDITWLSTDVSSTSAGRYDSKTNSKVYGPFNANSDFTENTSKITFSLKNAPSGTKILNDEFNEITSVALFEDFYVSVPNTAKNQTFTLQLLRNAGMILPLTYEAHDEDRQRMFFSTTTNTSTEMTIVHTQSNAQLTIIKTAEDSKIKDIPFSVYYHETEDSEYIYLGTFKTDTSGKITLNGLSAGYYDVFEDLSYEDSLKYTVSIVDNEGNTIMESDSATVIIPENEMEKNHTVRFQNNLNDSTKIILQKVDKFTFEPVSGAKFKVVKVNKNSSGQYVPCKDANGNVIQWEGKTYDDSFGKVLFDRTEENDGTDYLVLDATFTNGELLPENNTFMIGETEAPNGYVKLEDKYLFTINDETFNRINYLSPSSVEDNAPYYLNRPFLNSLKVIKYEEGTTTPIPDVQYNIYEVYDNDIYSYIDTITTDKNGIAIYGLDENGEIDTTNGNALRYGFTYAIKEISAPEGFETNTEYIHIPGVTEDMKEIVITQYNPKTNGDFELLKVDKNDEPIENTEFELYRVKDEKLSYVDDYINAKNDINKTTNAGGYITYSFDKDPKDVFKDIWNCFELVDTYITDENGKIVQNLEYGEYVLLESKAADGYSKLNNIYRFGIYESDEVVKIKCVNTIISASVEFLKVDAKKGTPIEGAIFTLMKDNSKVSQTDTVVDDFTTDAYGKISVQGLEFGDYYFVEKFTPEPYVKPNPENTKKETFFTIDGTQEIIKITYENESEDPNIIVHKKDNDSQNPIADVKFQLLKSDGTLYREGITNKEGICIFADVELGTYILKEISAPLEYDISGVEPITIIVDKIEDKDVYVGNDKIRGTIKILKIDEDTKEPLENVEFSLYSVDDEDNAIATLRTGTDGTVTFENIEHGDYVVKETETVEGYRLSETPIYIEVREAKEYFYTVTNEMIKRTIKLIKVEKDTVIRIADVEFEVYALINDEEVYYCTVTTDENGECTFTLPFGEYILKETKTGKGYLLTEETTKIDLTLEDIEDILEITIENTPITSKVTLRKSGDKIGNYLEGAVYGLYDLTTDKLLAEGTSDEAGLICFGELRYGSYYLKEHEAPEGYELSEDEIKFTIDENSPAELTIDVVDKSTPQTGFNSNFAILSVLSLASTLLFIALTIFSNKLQKRKNN